MQIPSNDSSITEGVHRVSGDSLRTIDVMGNWPDPIDLDTDMPGFASAPRSPSADSVPPVPCRGIADRRP